MLVVENSHWGIRVYVRFRPVVNKSSEDRHGINKIVIPNEANEWRLKMKIQNLFIEVVL